MCKVFLGRDTITLAIKYKFDKGKNAKRKEIENAAEEEKSRLVK